MATSRIGKLPIPYDKTKVQVTLSSDNVSFKAGKNTCKVTYRPEVKVNVKDDVIEVHPVEGKALSRAYHGLYRTLISNAIQGLTEGFSKTLILNGVGYRASISGKNLNLSLGYSHPIVLVLPEGIEVKVDKQTKIIVSGFDKALVGQVAANIRKWRPVEPYLGKGIRYDGEHVIRKAGKSGGK